MRDHALERRVQGALDDGSSVWVVGDIHGYCETFEALLGRLNLSDGDMVVCLGAGTISGWANALPARLQGRAA